MSKFHSTLTRRQFMKALGLTGAGLGAAATAPIFHDTDEMLSSPQADWKRPWYVKHLEFEKPSREVDWSMMYRPFGEMRSPLTGRIVGNWTGQSGDCQSFFLGETERQRLAALGGPFSANALKTGQPGMSHRCRALSQGNKTFPVTFTLDEGSTPESLGVPKWSATPEENARLLRTAMLHFGAAEIGYGEITSNTVKLLRSHDKANNKPYVFEDVPRGFEATDRMVYPKNVPLYDFAWTYPMNKEGFRSSPSSDLQGAANSMRYSEHSIIQPRVQRFMHALGYTVYGYVSSGTSGPTASEGPATLCGLGEGGRNNGVFITPNFGPVVGLFSMLTDLPVAPTPPIESGSWKFCQTCTLCADSCPFEVISFEHEPSFEIPQIYGKPDTTHIPGKKEFNTNGVGCWALKATIGGCGNCMGVCTFNVNSGSLHDYIRGVVGTTSLFNGFLWNMGKLFDFNKNPDKEAWFDRSQPSHSFDTALVTKGKAY